MFTIWLRIQFGYYLILAAVDFITNPSSTRGGRRLNARYNGDKLTYVRSFSALKRELSVEWTCVA